MYSIVLMMAIGGQPATPAFGPGCTGCGGCGGCRGCWGWFGRGCGGCGGLTGYLCHGCGGCYGYGGCGGCHGYYYQPIQYYGFAGCYGSCFGSFTNYFSYWSTPPQVHYGYGMPMKPLPPPPAPPAGPPAVKPEVKPGGPPAVKPMDPIKKTSLTPSHADLVVNLPADAVLFANGIRMSQTSATRRFVTPELQPGQSFHYVLEAEVTRDGKTIRQTRNVEVAAGGRFSVDFGNMIPTDRIAQK